MRTLLYQPHCGISGDMHIAAMLELGVPLELLNAELAKLPVAGEFELAVEPAEKMGINGTRVRVHCSEHHHHRHHSDIVAMIEATDLAAGVKQRALSTFEHIARAEAKIHNVPVASVHFHEVGAVDSIVDIVAAAVCLEYLDIEAVHCTPIEVGSGHVDCAHGRFPVPAPATQELLMGAPCNYGGVSGESTTPTGAAILKDTVTSFTQPAGFIPEKTGYGIGHKDFELPNVLRATLGRLDPDAPLPSHHSSQGKHFKIEANIDDMTPEAFEPLLAALLDAGAGDAWITPIVMKKSRAAACLSVLAGSTQVDALAGIILNQSTTIGLRILPFTKQILDREELSVATTYGPVRIKRVTQPDGRQRWKSEHDDVARYALDTGQDYRSVKQHIDYQIERALRADATD